MSLCVLLFLLAAPRGRRPWTRRSGWPRRPRAPPPRRPAEAVTLARQALARTAEFDPIAFVRAGRKGEVVEDTFQAARAAYRQHRAGLYEAAGVALAAAGKPDAAARHLRRALALEATAARASALARALLVLGRGREALQVLQSQAAGPPTAESIPLFVQAADAVGAAQRPGRDRPRAAAAR